MVEASVAFMPDAFTAYTQGGVAYTAQTRAAFSLGFVFNCADDKMVAIQVSSTEKFWHALIAAIERPDIGADARFDTRAGRITNFQALIDVLRPVFAAKPREFWMRRLAEQDVPGAPVLTIPEVIEDAEVRHLGVFHQLEHPRYAKMTAQRRPMRINGERESHPLPPPALGEHTEAVLAELGFSAAEIEAFRNEQIL
jgi:crotonobetainyl-CoA:carnitine CoA-transferase CaiB-like acyl-CoA transferase